MDGCEAPPCTANDAPEEGMEGRNIELDFGRVEIFRQRTRLVTFMRPMTDEDIAYTITKNRSIKSIKANFELDHHQGVLKPGQNFRLAVTYKPTMASVRDIDVFDYTDIDNENIKITVTGVAVGPRCSLSAKHLDFYRGVSERKVELRNDSTATALFKVDHPDGDVFRVRPLEGAVPPNSCQYLTVRFRPPRLGLFARKIFCLVWNCEPLVLNVVALHSTDKVGEEVALRYAPNDLLSGFRAYLEAGQVALAPPCLDFGYALPPQTMRTTVINHRPNKVLVDWRQGSKSGRATVSPPTAQVPPNGCQAFEVQLRPDVPYSIFQETLMAQVDWIFDSSSNVGVPLNCALRVQGHSFPGNETWINHVEILPEVVYWQPCAPGDVAGTTFLMRNRSHLPVLYRLEPPKASKITAKPMMGLFRHTEIVAVQLQTDEVPVKTYIEAWRIVVNGRDERPLLLYFHGETCVPEVEIGTRNRINAGAVQAGSQKEVEVQMRNSSYYAIRYQFQLAKKSIVSVEPTAGTLPANETQKLLVKVTGSQCAPPRERFHCQMRIIDACGAVSGNSYEVGVDVITECSYSQLCACPDSKDFGRVPFGQRLKCDFQAVNFGDTNVFFQTCQTGDEALDNSFRIKPCFGEVTPRDCRHFSVGGIVSQVGGQTLHFGYYNRMVKDSPLVTGAPITLFTLSYVAELPVVQVAEIVEHDFGRLFGKSDLYVYYLDVPRLNQTLRQLVNDDTLEHRVRLPEFPVQSEHCLRLALHNVSDFDTSLSLKRLQLCDCSVQEMAAGMSERKRAFDCPHRAALTLTPLDINLPAHRTSFLSVCVKYVLAGVTPIQYALRLSNNRTLLWHFDVYGIAAGLPRLSTYTAAFGLRLPPTRLGDHKPPLHTFWLYNNTGRALAYEVDVGEMERLGRRHGRPILQLLNPLGHIPDQHSQALLVKFEPIEARSYAVELGLRYCFPEEPQGALQGMLLLEGEGVLEERAPERSPLAEVPRLSRFSSNFPITLSVERLELPPLPIWSRRTELLFIKNNSRTKILQYVWHGVRIQDVLEVSTETQFGILQPREIQPVVIVVKALATPCATTLLLPCELVQYSDRLLNQLTEERHLEAERRIEEFMLGEPRWASRPVNPITVVPAPPTLFASVTITLATVAANDFDCPLEPCLRQEGGRMLPFPEKGPAPPVLGVLEREVFCRVLEEALSQAVFSQGLRNRVEQAHRAPMHYYSEFARANERRPQKIERFLGRPKPPALAQLLQGLIYRSVMTLAQCPEPHYDLGALQDSVERSLYTCRNKGCACSKPDDP